MWPRVQLGNLAQYKLHMGERLSYRFARYERDTHVAALSFPLFSIKILNRVHQTTARLVDYRRVVPKLQQRPLMSSIDVLSSFFVVALIVSRILAVALLSIWRRASIPSRIARYTAIVRIMPLTAIHPSDELIGMQVLDVYSRREFARLPPTSALAVRFLANVTVATL